MALSASSSKLKQLLPKITTTSARSISHAALQTHLLPESSRLSSNPSKMPPKEELQFGRTFCDHMLTIIYENGKWGVPKIARMEDLKLSPASSSLHYGEFQVIDELFCSVNSY